MARETGAAPGEFRGADTTRLNHCQSGGDARRYCRCASVGFGFAAFESAGYALTAALTENGLSLMDLVTTQLFEDADQTIGRDRCIHFDVQRLAVEVIHHVEGPEATTTGQRIGHEVG